MAEYHTIDITPHWPGVCRWLVATFRSQMAHDPVRVAIVGGEHTNCYAVDNGQVFVFDGQWHPCELDVMPMLLSAYCGLAKDKDNGEWVYTGPGEEEA